MYTCHMQTELQDLNRTNTTLRELKAATEQQKQAVDRECVALKVWCVCTCACVCVCIVTLSK